MNCATEKFTPPHERLDIALADRNVPSHDCEFWSQTVNASEGSFPSETTAAT